MKTFYFVLALLLLPNLSQAAVFCGRLDMRGSGGIIAGSLHDLRPDGEHRTLDIGEARIEAEAEFPENPKACVCLTGEIRDDGQNAIFTEIDDVSARVESACAAESL
jgi:hypothetical protein